MIDKISHDRIALLHPKIREEVGLLLDFVNTQVLTGKAKMRITSTLRTPKEQDALYALGRTVKNPDGLTAKRPLGQTVTNARAWESNHNYALSFDFALIVDNNGDGIYDETSWSTVKDYDVDKLSDWMEVINLFKKHGFASGSDWKSIKDFPHIEKTFGYSLKDLKAKALAKQFIPGTSYVAI
jgi:peptidoglycan L-alanyl-D-glutamate endopeptidase CwlK